MRDGLAVYNLSIKLDQLNQETQITRKMAYRATNIAPNDVQKMLDNCANFDKDVRHTGALDLCNMIASSAE